jgi:hypothetical protein
MLFVVKPQKTSWFGQEVSSTFPGLGWSGSWSNGQLVEGHFVPVPDGRLYNRMSNNPMYIRPSAPGEFRRLCTVRRLYIVESVSFPNLVSDLL